MFNLKRPVIIAHRGVSVDGARNTVASTKRAIELGAGLVEFDVRQARDGLVVFHDAAVAGIPVEKLSHAQLIQKSGLDVPRPEAILRLAKGRIGLVIEFKQLACVEPMVKMIKSYCDPENTILCSFDDATVAACKALLPGFQAGLLLGDRWRPKHPLTWLSDIFPALRIAACRPDIVIARSILARTGIIAKIHRLGLPIILWRANRPPTIQRLLSDPRVLGIITDDVAGALKSSSLHLKQQGHGPTLVLIHGVGGSSRIWDPVVPALEKHFRLIRVDLLGYGHSPKPQIEFTPEAHITAIHEALRAQGATPPFVLVGLSMGSLIALEYAKRWPQEVKRVLCIGLPLYHSPADARLHLRTSFTARMALEWGLCGRIVISTIWSLGRRSRRIAKFFTRLYTPVIAQESMLASYHAFYSTLTNCLVENRPVPLLDATAATPQAYLHGENDRYTPADAVASALEGRANCRLTLLPRVAHNAVILAPALTAAWIEESSL